MKRCYSSWLTFLWMILSAGTHSIVIAQSYSIHFSPQATSCQDLSDQDISDCTDNILFDALFRDLDTIACNPIDTSFHYKLSLQINRVGGVLNASVSSWNDLDSPCLQMFNERAAEIARSVQFNPAMDKSREPIEGSKHFTFSYPSSYWVDSLRALGESVTAIEHMPRFVGCEHIVGSNSDIQQCSDRQLLQFLYGRLKYPHQAIKKNTEGQVFVQFVVENTGMIDSIQVVKDIGHGCGASVVTVLEEMNQLNPPFIPGLQRGQPVRVLYTLPVTFKLQDPPRKRKKKRKNQG